MTTYQRICRLSSITCFGIICGSFNSFNNNSQCQSDKYHAWNRIWKLHHENNSVPPWDPGYATTATQFLDEVELVNTDNQQISILIPLCGASHDMSEESEKP